MTILTETRWKCDYCGNVSPVTEEKTPLGWIELSVIQEVRTVGYTDTLHFCTEAHKQAWLKEREGA